jgi:fatty-acyl-CoA synthase
LSEPPQAVGADASGLDLPPTIPVLLARSVAAYADRTALVTHHERWTYRELAAAADRYARALVATGVAKGSRIGLLMENGAEWVAFALGATSLGALLVPISTFAHRDDLGYHLRHADVEHLFMTRGFLGHDYLEVLTEVTPSLDRAATGPLYLDELPALRTVTVRGGADLPAACTTWDAFLARADAVPATVSRALRDAVDAEDDCYLLTTSGTTARPKGVLLSHGAVAGNGHLIGDYQGLVPDDVVWFYFPLFFSAGCINVMLGTLSHGAALILQPTLDAGLALELIDREGATTWHIWPHQLQQLLTHPNWGARDHSRLHKGTAPYDVLCAQPPADGLGGVNMYGMTETATAFSCTHASEPLDVRLHSQGHLLPGNELRVMDPETGSPAATGVTGELYVKGPRLMRRYYKVDPAQTFTADGFFRTGDLGHIDADGRIHFEQRLKDVIKTGGINVSPADVESTLGRAPGVGAAYVFPLPGGDRGEVVGVAIVPSPGHPFDQSAFDAFCHEELAGFKRPHAVLVLSEAEVPMTGSGKIRKQELRERLVAALDAGLGPIVITP